MGVGGGIARSRSGLCYPREMTGSPLEPHDFVPSNSFSRLCLVCGCYLKASVHRKPAPVPAPLSPGRRPSSGCKSTRQVLEESGEYGRALNYGVRLGG